MVLAATLEVAGGRTDNVAEAEAPGWQARLGQLGAVMGWQGRIVVIPDEELPEALLPEAFLSGLPNFQRMPDYHQDYRSDSSRIRRELGYGEVVTVPDGLRLTTAWVIANPPPTTPENWFDYEAEDRLLRSLR